MIVVNLFALAAVVLVIFWVFGVPLKGGGRG